MRLRGANPGSDSRLEFTLPAAARVSLALYDVQGRRVRTLLDQDAAAGTFAAQWDGRDDRGVRMGRGVYFARLVAGAQVTEKKLVLE
jgi:flagellar hook assembly protein FlgD